MTRPTDGQLLAFLEETLEADERARVLDQLAADPKLAAELEGAAAGLDALRSLRESPSSAAGGGARRVSPVWLVAVAVATLAISVPATIYLGGRGPATVAPATSPEEPENPEFVLVLRGRWSDDIRLESEEFERRLGELREWMSRLAADGVLIGASDLALDQGVRFGSRESPEPSPGPDTDYIVGVLTLRMDAYHEALAVARSCPHLRYGGTVTVRRAGAGFFTVRGKPDFSG